MPSFHHQMLSNGINSENQKILQVIFSKSICIHWSGCWTKNRGKAPQIIHFNRVWNHYFHHHPFWGVKSTPICIHFSTGNFFQTEPPRLETNQHPTTFINQVSSKGLPCETEVLGLRDGRLKRGGCNDKRSWTPKDFQPFINGWLQGVPGSYFSKGLVQPTSNSMDFFSEAFETSIRRMTCLEDHPRTDLDTDTWFKNWPMMGCVFVFGP